MPSHFCGRRGRQRGARTHQARSGTRCHPAHRSDRLAPCERCRVWIGFDVARRHSTSADPAPVPQAHGDRPVTDDPDTIKDALRGALRRTPHRHPRGRCPRADEAGGAARGRRVSGARPRGAGRREALLTLARLEEAKANETAVTSAAADCRPSSNRHRPRSGRHPRAVASRGAPARGRRSRVAREPETHGRVRGAARALHAGARGTPEASLDARAVQRAHQLLDSIHGLAFSAEHGAPVRSVCIESAPGFRGRLQIDQGRTSAASRWLAELRRPSLRFLSAAVPRTAGWQRDIARKRQASTSQGRGIGMTSAGHRPTTGAGTGTTSAGNRRRHGHDLGRALAPGMITGAGTGRGPVPARVQPGASPNITCSEQRWRVRERTVPLQNEP